MSCKMLDELTHPLTGFNGSAIEVSEWISNFTYFIMDVIINYIVYHEYEHTSVSSSSLSTFTNKIISFA